MADIPLATLSDVPEPAVWQTLTLEAGWTGTIQAARYGPILIVNLVEIRRDSEAPAVAARLPAGLRPAGVHAYDWVVRNGQLRILNENIVPTVTAGTSLGFCAFLPLRGAIP